MKPGSFLTLVIIAPFTLCISSGATLNFGAASSYDNNFLEYTNPGDVTWNASGNLRKGVAASATTAIYNTTAINANVATTPGSGGTGVGTPNNNTFTDFVIQMDMSAPLGESIGFIARANSDATAGYFGIFRLLSTGSADFRVWDSDSNPSTGALGASITGTSAFTVGAGSFAANTAYSFRMTVQDVGSNLLISGAIFSTATGLQIGNTLSYTDTTSPLASGQAGIRLASSSATANTFDNFSINAIPEPGAALLGLFGLTFLLRRNR